MDMQGLSLICAGLGIAEEDENGNRIGYSKGESCADNLKDLLRFLRRDDPQTREVFKQVCKWNTVSKDLMPIIQFCQDDRDLVLNAVKVLVFLTMPIEPSSSDINQQIEYLWGLKSAITCSDAVPVIVSLLEDPLENLENKSFTEDDWKLLQLVLTLFRNILAIQEISLMQKVGGAACQLLLLRDRFLELLFRENVMDLIIVLTQHVGGSYGYLRHDNLLLLEVFHYILLGQEPELIAKAHVKDSKVAENAKASVDSLKSIMEEEEEKRKLSRLRSMGRHSQFSGTFTRLTMDGSKAVRKGNPNSASQNDVLTPHKVQRSAAKKIVWDHARLPSMQDHVLELLHDFLNQFLSGGYNVLMQSIREDIEKEHHAIQDSDIIIFFQVAQFATSFQYHKFLTSKPNIQKGTSEAVTGKHADSTLFEGDICGPIAASMNDTMFLLLIARWHHAFDGLKETHNYKFLSAAGSLMKIMIRMLDLVLKLLPEDSKEPQTARILLYKLFYDQTDEGMTQFLLSLIKSFDIHKQPKSDLADLIETAHVIVRLMENLQARGTLRVSKKSRQTRKKKALKEKETKKEAHADDATIQDETAVSVTGQYSELGILPEKTQENGTSGHQKNTVDVQAIEPEMSAPERNPGGNLAQMDVRTGDHIDNDLSCSSDDSSGGEPLAATYEVDFKVSTFVSAFANHSIIRNLCWLLRFYKSNSVRTNHYVICMLQRITDELDLSPMLYQLSLLTTFHDILVEQKSCPCKEHENIIDFLKTLVRRMLRKMKNQPLIFVEALFWKSRKECHYIDAEYLLHELGHMKKESTSWQNVSANGGVGSSQAKGWFPRSIADALGEDEADVVISRELDYQRERESDGGIQKDSMPTSSSNDQGKENYDLAGNTMQHVTSAASKRKRRLVLSDELETRIKDLYEKFKDNPNCTCLIAESLDPDGEVSPAQVFNKLKQLGLKVASKKRMRHVGGPATINLDQDGENGKIVGEESDAHNLVDLEGSLLKSLSSRKRVRAINKDKEEMIKALFEQFKDHRRCSHMIANALAADHSLTAAQVSRKLKQLGLRIPRQKYKADMYLRDKEMNKWPPEGQESDDETLLSLRNRRKNNGSGQSLGMEQKGNLSDASDDEFLNSVFKKTQKIQPKAKDKKFKKTSGEKKSTDEKSDDGVTEDTKEWDGSNQPIGMDVERIDKGTSFDHVSPEYIAEADETGSIAESKSSILPVDQDDLPYQLMDDLDDGMPSVSLVESVEPKRKLRMVIDSDDENY